MKDGKRDGTSEVIINESKCEDDKVYRSTENTKLTGAFGGKSNPKGAEIRCSP